MSPAERKHCLVIGAGCIGLAAAKELLEQNVDVTVVEKKESLGGLWTYTSGDASVTGTTWATSSKAFLQFSDFPMGKEMAEFPTAVDYVKYLHKYAEHFRVLPCIKFQQEVLSVRKDAVGAKWEVMLRCKSEGTTRTEMFDGVVVCSGAHHTVSFPKWPGSDKFEGEIIHSAYMPDYDMLSGKRVVIIGGGESGADCVHESSKVGAKELFLSLRKGMAVTRTWFPGNKVPADFDATRAKLWLPRQFLHDMNVDCRLTDRFCAFKTIYNLIQAPVLPFMFLLNPGKAMMTVRTLLDPRSWLALVLPRQRHGPPDGILMSKAVEDYIKKSKNMPGSIEDKAWQLKFILDWYSGAMHNSQPFTKRVHWMSDILAERCKLIPGIKSSEGKTITFADGTKREIDTVVCCTGFKSHFPFLEDPEMDARDLYKNVFMTHGDHTIGFCGIVRPNVGSLPVLGEMQSRWFAKVFTGAAKLPCPDELRTTATKDKCMHKALRPLVSERLTYITDYSDYMTSLACKVGCKPSVWRLFLFKPWTWLHVMFGPYVSSQFRIHGWGAKPGVFEQVVTEYPSRLFVNDIISLTLLYGILKPTCYFLSFFGLSQFKPVL